VSSLGVVGIQAGGSTCWVGFQALSAGSTAYAGNLPSGGLAMRTHRSTKAIRSESILINLLIKANLTAPR
jgi:hypothetical protein